MVARVECLAARPNQGTAVMSEIDIEAVRKALVLWSDIMPPAAQALTAIDQLAKENERLTKEQDEANLSEEAKSKKLDALIYSLQPQPDTDGYPSCGCSYDTPADVCLHHSPQLVAANQRIAAMQKAIVEAVRRGEDRYETEPLRPHLPTPEPEPVDPLVEVLEEFFDGNIPALDQEAERLRSALSARGLEVRKIGEGEA